MIALTGTNAPGIPNGLLTVLMIGFYTAQETQIKLRGSNITDIDY